MTKLRRMGDQ